MLIFKIRLFVSACNVLLQDTEAILTLSNFGKQSNCSVSALFPTYIKVLAMNVGEYGSTRAIKQESVIRKVKTIIRVIVIIFLYFIVLV